MSYFKLIHYLINTSIIIVVIDYEFVKKYNEFFKKRKNKNTDCLIWLWVFEVIIALVEIDWDIYKNQSDCHNWLWVVLKLTPYLIKATMIFVVIDYEFVKIDSEFCKKKEEQ